MDPTPKEVSLNSEALNKQYVFGDPTEINPGVNDKIKFSAENSGFSVVIDGRDGFFDQPQLWDEFIPKDGHKQTPKISGSVTDKEYSVFCVKNSDYHGDKQGINDTDSPPKIIIIS